MKIKCDYCGKEFEAGDIVLEKELSESGIERIYYKTPCCNFEHTVMITTKQLREAMQRRILMYKTYRDRPSKFLAKQINELSMQIQKDLDKLNGKK